MTRLVAVLLLALATPLSAADEKLLVRANWLAKHSTDPRVIVVNVGPNVDAYEAGHIPGALYLPLQSILTQREEIANELPPVDTLEKALGQAGIGDRGRIIIYGDDPLHAARLFFTLDYLGHGGRVALLDGGLAAWKRAGYGLATGSAVPVAPATFTARVRPDRVISLGQMERVAGTPGLALIDARPPAQYSGAEAGAGVLRPGHIPGAKNVFWQTNLDEKGLLLGVAELEAMYAAAGVRRGRPVITYCRTGMQSSFSYFVLRYLGHDAAMYDGSFTEWSSAAQRAVE